MNISCLKGNPSVTYISYMGMFRCEGYGVQAVKSGIGYRSHTVLYVGVLGA